MNFVDLNLEICGFFVPLIRSVMADEEGRNLAHKTVGVDGRNSTRLPMLKLCVDG